MRNELQRNTLIAGLAVALSTAAVFLPCTKYSFTRYDDIPYVVGNFHIRDGLTGESARWAFTDVGYASNWHPLTWISHAADISLAKSLGIPHVRTEPSKELWADFDSGLATISHIHNLVLHVANAVLLFALLNLLVRFVPNGTCEREKSIPYLAAAAALIWACHPLRSEVVCWVSERKEVLSVFFLLLTLICYVKGGMSRIWYMLSILLYVPALLAKPVAVSLPALLVGGDWCLRRIGLGRSFVRSLPHTALAVATVVLTMMAQTEGLTSGGTIPTDLRFVCAATAPAKYLAQTFWPFGLCIDYVVPTWADWGWIATGIVIVLVIVAACVWWIARPNFWSGVAAFTVAWSYVGLLPMLGIVKVGVEPHSDRYTYWVGCGIAALVFMILLRTYGSWRRYAKQTAYAVLVLMVAMAIVTRICSSVWRNSTTLFSNVVSKTYSEDFSYLLALEMYSNEGDAGAEKAEEMLRDVLRIKQTGEAEANLALILSYKKHKDYARAAQEIEMYAEFALAVNPKNCKAWAAKAMHAYRTNRYKKALELMERAFEYGFEPQVVKVDLDEWRKDASKEQADEESVK